MDRVRAVPRQDAERAGGLWIAGKGSETSSVGIEAEALCERKALLVLRSQY